MGIDRMFNPWVGIGLVLVMLVGLMVGLRWYRRMFGPHPELVRKLLHVGMGLTTLSFPWLFEANWPVVFLAAITIPALYGLRHLHSLKTHLGGVIDGVERDESHGEIYFPLGIAVLFVLAGGHPLPYSIPVLLLALADAVAALVGVRYGHTPYTTAEGYKSAEGSVAFFIVAFFSVHIPLLLFGDIGRVETLLIALILGFLMMMVEAIAWQGLDNLFIPIVGFIFLKAFLLMPVADLVSSLMVTVALTGFTLLWRREAHLNDSALLGAALIGYLSWTLGTWRWLVGPLIIFMGHIILSSGSNWPRLALEKLKALVPRPDRRLVTPNLEFEPSALNQQSKTEASTQPTYTIHAVLSVGFGPLVWLILFKVLDRPEYFYPFMLAWAGQLAIMNFNARQYYSPHRSLSPLMAISIVVGWLWLFGPFILLAGVSLQTFVSSLVALPGVVVGLLIFVYTRPIVDRYDPTGGRWLRQAICPLVGSMVALSLPLIQP